MSALHYSVDMNELNDDDDDDEFDDTINVQLLTVANLYLLKWIILRSIKVIK